MSVAVPFAREVLKSTVSQRVTSLVTLLIVLGATATVLATAGRSAGAEAAVLARVDAAGTRSLTVYAQGDQPEMTSALVDQMAGYDVVSEVSGFGPTRDVTAASTPQGTRVASRPVYGQIGQLRASDVSDIAATAQAWATPPAATALGFAGGTGAVRVLDGPELLVTRTVALPSHLGFLGPAVMVPRTSGNREPLSSMVVVADSPQDLPLVTALLLAALRDVPPDGYRVESSQELADLRATIGGELSTRSRGVVLGVLGAAAAATLVTVWSLALMRRRDFGRRRALGASRAMVASLVVSQVAVLAVVGAVMGGAAGWCLLLWSDSPLPPARYCAAAVAGLVLTATVASTLPALWASRRDPLTELRVP